MIQIISTNETNHVEIKKSTCNLSCSKPATMTTNSDDQLLTRLGSDFRPGPFDIICARGMEARLHNEQFHEKIKESVDAYTNAESKLYKSIVVSSAVEWFRKASPNGGFVKESRGSWYRVSDFLAREKVGQALRDKLHSRYKSSSKAKRRRWKKEGQEKTEKEEYFRSLTQTPSITERMERLQESLNGMGDDVHDESLLNLFTQNSCFILNAIHSDTTIQEGIKKLYSCQK